MGKGGEVNVRVCEETTLWFTTLSGAKHVSLSCTLTLSPSVCCLYVCIYVCMYVCLSVCVHVMQQRAREVASVRQLVQRRKKRQRQRKAAITLKTGEGTIVPLVVKGAVQEEVE